MNKVTLAVAAALALVATPALAADEAGFYAGVGAGIFNVDIDDDAVDDAIDDALGDDDTGFRVFGGWQFNQYFGIEGGYDGGAGIDGTVGDIAVDGIEADLDVDVSGFDLMLVGTLPIGDAFYGFAKAGVLFWDIEADAVIREDDGEGGVITTTESGDDSGEDPAFGVGFGMNLGENARVQVEYTDYHFTSDVDGNFISGSFVWRFK
ncbi:MAG: porin family protein [Steroidobacteraceae bacterium]